MKKRVGVLMGGPSSEHDVSLLSGANVMRALKDKFEVVPIFITASGSWLVGDRQHWMSPTEALSHIDVAFNALHGEFGEDGKVQQILDHCQIPYTGSTTLASAITMNKAQSQVILEKAGLRLPRSIVLGPGNLDTRVAMTLSSPPWIVKPRSRGSSVGVSKVNTQPGLAAAYQKALAVDSHIIEQEFIPGREVTCGVLENFNGQSIIALAPVEIIPPAGSDFFDTTVKYNGTTQEICPAEFYGAMCAKIQETAIKAHKALGLRHYSRTDMIIKSSLATRRAPEIYVLEVNSLPGLTTESLFPKAARHAGLEMSELAAHLVDLAITSKI
ncbi:MAG: D-alanine--D-alanine ligase [Patescibacteria group bacterium]